MYEYELGPYTEERECSSCGYIRVCAFGPDPFAAEIRQDYTPVWQCGECAYQSAMDI